MIRRHALLALACAAAALSCGTASAQDVLGNLVLYTSQPNADAQQTVDAFQKAYPGVKVQWVRDGTTKIMAKLRAEFAAGQPQPDVLLIADMVTMAGLKKDGRLMADPEVDVSKLDAGLYDPDKTYFSTKLITTGIVYNTSAKMVPTSYKDLLKPEARNSIAMPSPMTSGAATITMDAITADPDLGWAFYRKLAEQGANPQGGNGGTYKAVAGGDKLYGFVVDFLPIRAEQKGAPVKFVFPKEGVSAVTEPVAILKTAKNVPAAKAFVSFLLSKKGQQLASDMGYLPADAEVTPPPGFPPRAEIKLLPFDPAKALTEDKQNKEKFLDIFGG
ncbi:ABC transporter substrate-binding protein [Acidimangrovimonas pyrenivorans]|uniref:ABC transporter substrate-binding protein n=1 Tax=Acidimangrovimonas pyrenivorans TaxID=2030798 RepID=A0ABV7AGD7_9RHOB